MRSRVRGSICWVVLGAALLVCLAGGRSRAEDGLQAEIARGRDIATALCSACHLRGTTSDKAGVAGIPSFQAVANRPGQSHEHVVAWLRGRPPMMPDHRLTRDEMEAVAAYILSLRRQP